MAKKKALRKKSKSKITLAPRKDAVKPSDSNKDKALAPAPVVKDAAATAKALELLQSPDFFNKMVSVTRRLGLVGEERNALVVYTVGVSRLLAKPLCLFIKGASSAGKNCLADTVLALFPQSEHQNLTSASLRSWNYMGDQLQHKIVYVAERNEQSGQVHPVRLLISENELIHWVTVKRDGQFIQERQVTKGPIASISTTTRDEVEVDDETRHVSVWMDESPEQTTRIVRQALIERQTLADDELKAWHEVQRMLGERAGLAIEFPSWFEAMSDFVRNDDVRVRRYFPAFLQACKTIALIRSFKRDEEELRKETKITVKFTDLAIAALIFGPVFAQSLDKVSEEEFSTQQHVERISARMDGQPVSATDLAQELNISSDKAYSLLRSAMGAGTISRVNPPARTNPKLYLPATGGSFLPDPEGLFHKLRDSSSERVKFIHPITGEWVEYRRDGRHQ